jgi:hypothetical protein
MHQKRLLLLLVCNVRLLQMQGIEFLHYSQRLIIPKKGNNISKGYSGRDRQRNFYFSCLCQRATKKKKNLAEDYLC